MGTAGVIVALSPLSAWQESTDLLEQNGYRLWDLPTVPSRMPSHAELEMAARSAGLDPDTVCLGGLDSVDLESGRGAIFDGATVGHVLAIAAELAPVTGPLVVLDVAGMVPVVVAPDDTAEERLAWLDNHTVDDGEPAAHALRIVSLAAYQWVQVRVADEWVLQRVADQGLGWIRRPGLGLPTTDPSVDHSPHPSEVAPLLRVDGVWSLDKSRWSADGSAHGLGDLSARQDPVTRLSMGLECRGARALPAAQLARRLSEDCGPLVLGREDGPMVLVQPNSDPRGVAELIEDHHHRR